MVFHLEKTTIKRALFQQGVLADALDRRKMPLIVTIVMMLFSAILALCTSFQIVNLIIIFVLMLVNAVASSFEFPARLLLLSKPGQLQI